MSNKPSGPIADFQREIADWPVKQAKLALEVVSLVLRGESAKANQLSGDLSVGQLRKVHALLECIEAEAEAVKEKPKPAKDSLFQRLRRAVWKDDAAEFTLNVFNQMLKSREIRGFEFVSDDVRSLIVGEPAKTRASLVEDRLSPEALICLLITNVTFQKLSSGRYHVYRGVLGHAGNEMLAAYLAASLRMVELGTHTRQHHEKDYERLCQEIKEAG